MLTVPQAFDRFRQDLEITSAEDAEASRGQNHVRAALDQRLGGITRDFLSGSYARRTAIRPLHDIDIFVVLDPTAHRDVYPTTNVPPSACLNKIHRALAAAFPTAELHRVQNRSVGLRLSGIGYDVVPAFANQAGAYIIPDRERDAWIQTNPEPHRAVLVAANERAGGKLNALIKMVKHWKCEHGVDVGGFYLEVMAYGGFSRTPESYSAGVRALFAHLAGAVLQGCPDPAGVGANIDAGMTQERRTRVRERLVEAEGKAREAIEHERAGRVAEAHRWWRWLFGGVYPVG